MSVIGKTLGNFQCTALLGKGGMGEVYRAKDQKLGRDVAIKVLPEEFAKDADRVARFQREAKLLASLNHPNIAAIHGLEEANGTHFLVLELIEGDTLADRIKGGPIPVEESLKLALQIAEALEAAHEKGVIHRDLKPANIKVTSDGKVKVLDFGLAKAFAGDTEDMNLSNSPTLSVAATQQGIILGTAAYMSPEQASGETTDKRTDIWAFGVVLFEMLTGRSLFEGNNVSQTLASVIKSEPEWKSLPPNLHPRIRLLLERCLEKEAKNRYHDIADARVDVQKVLSDPSGVFAQTITTVKPRKKLRLGIPWVAAAIGLTALIIGVAIWMLKPAPTPEPKQVMRFEYELPEGQEFTGEEYKSVAVSADGKMIVYVANNQLYLKKSDEFTARPIQGTDKNPVGPFFSPDGQWIGYSFLEDRQLKKISIMGGVPVTVCDDISAMCGIWGKDDRIVFSDGYNIMRVSANGGTPEEIVKGKDEILLFPQILPDGKSVLFSTYDTKGKFFISVQSLESGKRKDLFAGFSAQYLPTGHIVFGLENDLAAIRFNPDTLETIGGSVPMIEDVYRPNSITTTNSAISESGTLIYIPGRTGTTSPRELVWVDREGHEEPLGEEPNTYDTPNISPDGTQVALSVTADGNTDIYIHDLVRGTNTRLTFHDAADYLPIWTPDGKRIIFSSLRSGRETIFWKAANGTGEAEQLVSVPQGWLWIWPFSLSSDSSTLFFGQNTAIGTSGYNIGMLTMTGDERTPKLLLQGEYDEKDPMISPDGQWLAYMSNESGQYEIFVRPFPDVDSGGKRQVSRNGGNNPLWSPDGRELFYRNGDSMMVAPVDTKPAFKLGNPDVLFQGTYFGNLLSHNAVTSWDISPDGKRFLMIKSPTVAGSEFTSAGSPKINIVQNWFEELTERVPTD